MKNCILILSFVLATVACIAQQDNNLSYKKYEGCYGSSSSGLCLFGDGTFLLYGYATAVFGTYEPKGDMLRFYPKRPPVFEVYAHNNPTIGDSIRMNFNGFEEGDTFIASDQEKLRSVFNVDANCFSAPFVYQKSGTNSAFTLFLNGEDDELESGEHSQSWHYVFDSMYNDFILIYNKSLRYYKPFSAYWKQLQEDGAEMQLSDYMTGKPIMRYKKAESDSEWDELVNWKNLYLQQSEAENELYANVHYNTFPKPEDIDYTFNKETNQYFSKHYKENMEDNNSDANNDSRVLKKYLKIQPKETLQQKVLIPVSGLAPLFYTTCDEPEISYQYSL